MAGGARSNEWPPNRTPDRGSSDRSMHLCDRELLFCALYSVFAAAATAAEGTREIAIEIE